MTRARLRDLPRHRRPAGRRAARRPEPVGDRVRGVGRARRAASRGRRAAARRAAAVAGCGSPRPASSSPTTRGGSSGCSTRGGRGDAGRRPRARPLRLGAVTTAGEYLLPGLLASFLASAPARRGRPSRSAYATGCSSCSPTHQLDLVIGGRPPRGQGLVTRAVRAELARRGRRARRTDRTSRPRRGCCASRARAPARRPLGCSTRSQVDPPRLALGSHGAVVASATLGLGLALVSADAVARQLARG